MPSPTDCARSVGARGAEPQTDHRLDLLRCKNTDRCKEPKCPRESGITGRGKGGQLSVIMEKKSVMSEILSKPELKEQVLSRLSEC